MTWSYSETLAETKDQVRFLVGDTDTTDQLLQDEEIEFFLEEFNEDPYQAAIQSCRAIAARFAREVSHSGDGLSYSGSDLHKHYTALAEELDKLARRHARAGAVPYVGGISWREREKDDADDDLIKTSFRSHEHDHPETVKQRRYDPLRPPQ